MTWHDGTVATTDLSYRGDVGSLVIGAADGDASAWAELVANYSGLVSSVITAHRLSGADGARVREAVWLRLGQDLGTIRRPDRVGTWLAAVTRDECVKELRASARTAA
ncbi:MAG: hypothetical protein M3083_19980 [Actinomycetota bacterium]|nr:hypothetical protein [Actinomycetota bacterium]MDQ6946303.1 hypothetical protein [Actinomycetota bacterium]